MKHFHGYELKSYEDKTEVYKNHVLIATLEDDEKAKSYIVNELENEESTE